MYIQLNFAEEFAQHNRLQVFANANLIHVRNLFQEFKMFFFQFMVFAAFRQYTVHCYFLIYVYIFLLSIFAPNAIFA